MTSLGGVPDPLRLTIKDRGPLARHDPLYCLFDALRGVRAGGGGTVEIAGKGRSVRIEVVVSAASPLFG